MKRFRVFPGIIFVLLGMNVVIVAYTVYASGSDGGAAIEPDYYRKALAYDTIRSQERDAAALGWSYETVFAYDADAKLQVLRATLKESTGAPLAGAMINADAFPSVRANERARMLLRETAPGVYTAPIELTHAGQWRIELTIESRGHVVLHKSDILVEANP